MAGYPPEIPMDRVVTPSPEVSSQVAYTGSATSEILLLGLLLFVVGVTLFIIMIATSKRSQ